MLQIQGNLWDFHKEGHSICITTNGFVKQNGECVMGRGIAQQAAKRFPTLPRELGYSINHGGGNHLTRFRQYNLITFPVKHVWWEAADLDLIARSAEELGRIENETIYLPRPGCENGRRTWEEVCPIIAWLPDNFIICDLKA